MRRFLGAVLLLILLLLVGGGLLVYERPLWVADRQIRYHLWRSHVKSKYVVAGGYRLHYFEAQPPVHYFEVRPPHGEGKPLVLVHGLGARGEDWSAMIPTLAAAGFHVYVPDLLGYGRSARPDVGYSIALETTIVKDFMDSVGLRSADVAGWSLGGWVALKLTADHPEKVERLVLFDSAGIYFPATFNGSLFVPTDSPGLAKLSAQLTPRPGAIPEFVSRAVLRKLKQDGWVIQRAFASMERGRDLLDFKLPEIQTPTLIVWGQLDELIPLEVGEQMHNEIPNSALLVVEGCGHLAPAECPKPILRGHDWVPEVGAGDCWGRANCAGNYALGHVPDGVCSP